ncbi:TetR family transcriptional regulator [gamma proteobacterium BDW918]|jgi:AcrR family transcriptional regulator|uniref:TetR/AcrR family transcriptional regulator n=1 Tax=Spongiibacter pelagi TaxID=2760804 RepID=A0A927GX15_9GAMM|nr:MULTISPECIES: TetR/AcrR family transcriptional regulator [Cellvibrionales]EIF42745.1 TetR family transcriptional regulator [gamma proteobacterium BDW918]MAT94312.1 TetR/AcrR family transcriptional regulator [Halioglobus sp.]MAV31770.1 TetR/AcrR family transcriptional regulator [Cycloclasticus sp.]MAD62696.1 TetR/AcrR family transcriptional regulator [Haliea sp.]MAD65605.1 TetR/AcrR family transcriptional regulator [Haliea sp.]|tara:strand:- start:2651 stop:3958 length:1308 start_codon:yes stop_codon:yes gene_type:complete
MLPSTKKSSPRKRRRTQEERRSETSGKLLKATVDLLLENGYSRFRIADAAARAKVSRGGQTHHFSTKKELIEAAIERLFESEVGQAEFDAAKTADEDVIDQAARHAQDFLTSKLYTVSLNMLVSAGEEEHLADGVREISANSRVPIEEAWVHRIAQSGISRQEAAAILVLLWSIQRGYVVGRKIEGGRGKKNAGELEFAVGLLTGYLKSKRLGSPALPSSPPSPPGSKLGNGIPVEGAVDHKGQQGRSASTRDQILDTTYQIMRDLGHAGLRSAKVIDQSGVSRGGLLHHYPTKDLLVAAVYERIVDRIEQDSLRRIGATKDADILSAIVEDAQARFFDDSYKVTLDILIASGKDESLAKVRKALEERYSPGAQNQWASRLMESGVEAGKAYQITSFLWNMVKGIAVRNLVQKQGDLSEQVIALGLELAGQAARS